MDNAASLLADLLGSEKNLAKVLVIKGHSPELGTLVEAISHAAAEGVNQLQGLALREPGLDLAAVHLPPGEVAARKAIAATEEHQLLLSSGHTFEFNLLLTQAQALNYASHLAGVVADRAPDPETARQFQALGAIFDRLLKQVNVELRQLPPP